MSAALTLPYVWATAHVDPTPRECEPIEEGIQFYRRRTEAILRRYLKASLAVGRVGSVMQDVTLRGRASSYRMKNFEDVVIFAIDVEKCMKLLDVYSLKLVVKIAVQDYMIVEVAQQMGQDERTIARNYGKALDSLSREFLRRDILVEEDWKPCQERGGAV
ncbi:MAG TPA: hypothetical protein VGT04_04590 [Acidobacteriaceae bacterium]|nr:hypothetical protein [Acidobacteriaceae bacterium]